MFEILQVGIYSLNGFVSHFEEDDERCSHLPPRRGKPDRGPRSPACGARDAFPVCCTGKTGTTGCCTWIRVSLSACCSRREVPPSCSFSWRGKPKRSSFRNCRGIR